MSLRTKLMSSLVVTGLVLGVSSGLLFASETLQHAGRDKPKPQVSTMPLAFTVTDVSLEGDRLTLHGQHREGHGSVSITIHIPATQEVGDTEAPVRRIFDREDAH